MKYKLGTSVRQLSTGRTGVVREDPTTSDGGCVFSTWVQWNDGQADHVGDDDLEAIEDS
ncbi:MAG: hypothetical protein U0791_13940 [Gemmataceae bacterium]